MHAHLSWRLSINELFIDLVCFGNQLSGALGLLVLFTGHPKLDVLIAELALEERAEGGQAIWQKDIWKSLGRVISRTTNSIRAAAWL